MLETDRRYREVLTRAWDAALAAADPAIALRGRLPAPPQGRLVLIAAGKAAPAMAAAALAHYLPTGVSISGVVAAPVGQPDGAMPLEWFQAGHPLPDEGSVQAGHAVLGQLEDLQASDLVLVLLSGGASALLTVPDGLGLSDLRKVAELLLGSGADITEMNTVRRKLCLLKGGGLAAAAAPARVVTLAISDVVGDDLAAIGSGPTVPDPDGPADALEILERLQIDLPAVTKRLRELKASWRPSRIKADTQVIASGLASLQAAAASLAQDGYEPDLLSDAVTGDSTSAAASQAELVRRLLAGDAQPATPRALISGGETTVRLPAGAGGVGGRNSTFALSLAVELWGLPRVAALAADTDGIDGSSRAAGAFVTPGLAAVANIEEARAALSAGDSGGWFSRHDHAFITGPTGTNVNDLRIILVG